MDWALDQGMDWALDDPDMEGKRMWRGLGAGSGFGSGASSVRWVSPVVGARARITPHSDAHPSSLMALRSPRRSSGYVSVARLARVAPLRPGGWGVILARTLIAASVFSLQYRLFSTASSVPPLQYRLFGNPASAIPLRQSRFGNPASEIPLWQFRFGKSASVIPLQFFCRATCPRADTVSGMGGMPAAGTSTLPAMSASV